MNRLLACLLSCACCALYASCIIMYYFKSMITVSTSPSSHPLQLGLYCTKNIYIYIFLLLLCLLAWQVVLSCAGVFQAAVHAVCMVCAGLLFFAGATEPHHPVDVCCPHLISNYVAICHACVKKQTCTLTTGILAYNCNSSS